MSESAWSIGEDERLCDLQLASLFILQKKTGFCFGFDAVALADFCAVRKYECAADLGTGTGILPLLLYGREPTATFEALELDERMADMARRSVKGNGLEKAIGVACGDIREVCARYPGGAFSLVTCNPPYVALTDGCAAPGETRARAASEASITLSGVVQAAKYLLKNGGRFCFCLPPKRMAEAFSTLLEAKIEPKRVRFVHSCAEKEARLTLLEGVLNARPGLRVMPPLIVRDERGGDTPEVRRIYHLP